jgi:hypothetical protein
MHARPIRLTGAAFTLLLAACAGAPSTSGRVQQSRVEHAKPEPDPGGRATPQGPLAISGVERVVVKLEPRPGGTVRVVEFLSPDLTEAEKVELEDAIERGEVRPETGPERTGTTWTTTVVRRRR